MATRSIAAEPLREFVEQVFVRLGYAKDQAVAATDVLMWASLRGVDTHGVRNLKTYYVDRTLEGTLRPDAKPRVEFETPLTARMDGNSGLGLVCAGQAMRLAIDKSRGTGVGIVCVRNTHHLGPAGYFANMATPHGMLGLCATGHFFGKGNWIGVAPPGTLLPMFSTNPFSFAAPAGRHAPFVLDMATAVATVNRIEMHGQLGQTIPLGWACDVQGNPSTDPETARSLMPLGGVPETGGYKGAGLGLMVTILSGVLSGAWAAAEGTRDESSATDSQSGAIDYDQKTMGHFFAAMQLDAFQPLAQFRKAMDAMIDALHAAPPSDSGAKVCYPGEIEAATEIERAEQGIPISDYLFAELNGLAAQFKLQMPVVERR
jgi:LDH2 family malate/lactate/ureidoglycolate dehydrogenase